MRNSSVTDQHQQSHIHMESHGIQQLLVAEKKAAEKIADARNRKVKRLKQAKEEAEAEVERYRLQREKYFLQYEAQYADSDHVETKIQHDMETQLQNCKRDVEQNKDKVIEDLISFVTDVEPIVNPNFFILKSFNKI
ncbi:V-type proton ATPase subunit G 1-like [Diabrotica virgifera virgifera]|uniref:V-type proton ATPase subunit G n=1 Tax=Diabrotica virgifera virgifera TaxID=50390 RepID=A0ABM5KHN4_DIAVI|nr:V-type proton ATPase subunit G 1-like [Diabrotica virgifera virgifera]